jgi:hypothetical protein
VQQFGYLPQGRNRIWQSDNTILIVIRLTEILITFLDV